MTTKRRLLPPGMRSRSSCDEHPRKRTRATRGDRSQADRACVRAPIDVTRTHGAVVARNTVAALLPTTCKDGHAHSCVFRVVLLHSATENAAVA